AAGGRNGAGGRGGVAGGRRGAAGGRRASRHDRRGRTAVAVAEAVLVRLVAEVPPTLTQRAAFLHARLAAPPFRTSVQARGQAACRVVHAVVEIPGAARGITGGGVGRDAGAGARVGGLAAGLAVGGAALSTAAHAIEA